MNWSWDEFGRPPWSGWTRDEQLVRRMRVVMLRIDGFSLNEIGDFIERTRSRVHGMTTEPQAVARVYAVLLALRAPE